MQRIPPLAVHGTPDRTATAIAARRPRHAIAHATREIDRAHMWRAPDPAGGDEPPRMRTAAHRPRTWRQTRPGSHPAAVASRSRAVLEAETRIGVAGMVLGLVASVAVIRATAPWHLRGDWLLATVPLVALWTSVGGLVAIAVARAARGIDPMPELSFEDGQGKRRSILTPVAIGIVAGIAVVGVLHAAIAVSGWLSM
jgi:hypothetical protein